MMMQRFDDWTDRLAAFLESRRAVPFAWGRNDCALFAADAVAAMTGQDPAAALRGYSTAAEAARRMQAVGGLAALADAALGAQIDPKLAFRGDIVMLALRDRECLGVVDGARIASPGEAGLLFLPRSAATLAWRV